MSNKHKGQAVTIDILLATVFLILLLVVAISIWNSTNIRIAQNIIRKNLETTAIDISDQLTKSQGLPTDWETNPSSASYLGLAKSDHVLDIGKVTTFVNMNYADIKNLLGIKGHDFYFKLVNLLGETVQLDGDNLENGLTPSTTYTAIVNSRRTIIFNNEIIYMDVIVWR